MTIAIARLHSVKKSANFSGTNRTLAGTRRARVWCEVAQRSPKPGILAPGASAPKSPRGSKEIISHRHGGQGCTELAGHADVNPERLFAIVVEQIRA
eukprot:330838-Rhodomonas_salina.2